MVAPPGDSVPSLENSSSTKSGRRKRPKSRATSERGEREKARPAPPTPRAVGLDTVPQAPAHDAVDDKNGPRYELKSPMPVDLGEEEVAIIADERPRLHEALQEFRDRAREVEAKVGQLASRAAQEAEEDPGPRDEMASFLAAKQLLLMSYCQGLCSYAGNKVSGEDPGHGGDFGRLLELHTVLEKVRPLERKLKYQTDKLLRIATTPMPAHDEEPLGEVGDADDDPLSFRPRPEAMIPGRQSDSGADEGQTRRTGKLKDKTSSLYRAPRISSVPYEETARGTSAKERRLLERSRRRVRQGEVMDTLREEFGDQPEAIRAAGETGASGVSGSKLKKLAEDDRERMEFEENHMVRLTMSRKAKQTRAWIKKDAGRLETIADVGNAADFVRVARDADGFANQVDDEMFGAGSGKKRRKGGRSKSSGALAMAMGPVGKSMPGGRGSNGKRRRR